MSMTATVQRKINLALWFMRFMGMKPVVRDYFFLSHNAAEEDFRERLR